MKVSKLCNLRSLMLAVFLLTTAVSCGSKGANPFSKSDGQVDENVANLMGLAVGMTKGQVYDLVGVANYMEGYDWGSVWRYKIKKGGKSGTLANKEVKVTTCLLFSITRIESWATGKSSTTKPSRILALANFSIPLNIFKCSVDESRNLLHFCSFP